MKSRHRWSLKQEIPFHIMLIPGLLITFVYAYLPIFGIVMAFQRFNPVLSFWGSPFVGLANFRYVFSMPVFIRVLRNTLVLSTAKIIAGLVIPLILAILVNEVMHKAPKRIVQSSIFLPFFLSWSVLGGVVREIFSLDGLVNTLWISITGQDPIFFMANNLLFPIILVATDVWKGMGYNMIIYLAAITSIDLNLYEAAEIDGCGRWRKIIYITLPGMSSIIILLATLSIGQLLNAGFEQVFILYNSLVYQSSDIIDTFVYRLGLINGQLAPAAAVGLFKSVISLFLVGTAYYLAYRFSDRRIF